MKIGIVEYGIGNLGSVYSAFRFYNYDVSLVRDPNELEQMDVIVIAGVGNFSTTVSKLQETGFWDALNENVIGKKKPILGLCLGMQLFADVSYEDGENRGLGWIKGKVVKIEDSSIRVPHIGWDEVKSIDQELFSGMRYGYFYFMHSYHFVPEDKDVSIGTTNYNGFEIISAVRKGNIVGAQFHPEKSQGDGLRFLRNFIEVMS